MRLLLALCVLALFIAPAASAYEYPGQEPAGSVVTTLVEHAEEYWHAAGVQSAVCQRGVTSWEAPSLLGADLDAAGRGDGATCEVWIAASTVAGALAPLWLKNALDACIVVFHEDGHANGLGHDYPGIMGGSGKPRRAYQWAPPFCWRWAKITTRETMRGDGESERTIRRTIRADTRLLERF